MSNCCTVWLKWGDPGGLAWTARGTPLRSVSVISHRPSATTDVDSHRSQPHEPRPRQEGPRPPHRLLVAGAVAVGSGATFSSESGNTISTATSGTLLQSNSKDGAQIFGLNNLKPGDTLNGSVTITNTGTLPATFSLTETASTSAFTGEYLKLGVKNATTGATIYTGSFGGLVDGAKTDLGVLQPGAAGTYTFTVTLAQDAPNSEQGKSASAAYQWSSVQLDGGVVNQ